MCLARLGRDLTQGRKNMRVMAIDLGDVRTGIAISDGTGSIVGSTAVIEQRDREKVARQICRLMEEHRVERLVLGFPKNMDGTEGPRADLYREFADLLESVTGQKPALWDERRTTVDAHRILSEHNYHGKKRKNTVDAVAASLILEGYLGFLNR